MFRSSEKPVSQADFGVLVNCVQELILIMDQVIKCLEDSGYTIQKSTKTGKQ